MANGCALIVCLREDVGRIGKMKELWYASVACTREHRDSAWGGDMGFWDKVMGQAGAQFLDVIAWTDDSRDTVVYRFPTYDKAITSGSKLVVRESQAAIFVAEGIISDVFGPGTYTLDTRNPMIATFFQSIAYGMDTPYKGEIYFFNTRTLRAMAGYPAANEAAGRTLRAA